MPWQCKRVVSGDGPNAVLIAAAGSCASSSRGCCCMSDSPRCTTRATHRTPTAEHRIPQAHRAVLLGLPVLLVHDRNGFRDIRCPGRDLSVPLDRDDAQRREFPLQRARRGGRVPDPSTDHPRMTRRGSDSIRCSGRFHARHAHLDRGSHCATRTARGQRFGSRELNAGRRSWTDAGKGGSARVSSRAVASGVRWRCGKPRTLGELYERKNRARHGVAGLK